jgi:hypothetical protein
MRKLIFVSILFLFGYMYVNAQSTQQFINNLNTIIAESESNFKKIKGKKIMQDKQTDEAMYSCNVSVGAYSEFIYFEGLFDTFEFNAVFSYNKSMQLADAVEMRAGVLNIVDEMLQSGNYKKNEYVNDDDVAIIEITDLDENNIIKIETVENKYFNLFVYGRE